MNFFGVVRVIARSSQKYLVAGFFVAPVILNYLSFSVSAVDTNIGVSVCGSGAPGAFVSITEPISDSVINQPNITLRGAVNNASQIEIEVDGSYSKTIAVGVGQSTYGTTLSLTQGTHTILARANDVCGGQDDEESVVVTYTPDAELPSSGGTTPTQVGGGVTVNPEGTVETSPIAENSIVRQIEQLPVIGAAVSAVGDFAAAIGLESTVVGNGNAPAVAGVARISITVAALTTVVMASTLAPIAAQAVPGVSEVFNATSHRSMIYLGWVIRGIGVLAMAFAYFI